MKRATVKAFCEKQRTIPRLLDAALARTDPAESPFDTLELMLLVQALERSDYVAHEAGALLRVSPRKMSYMMARYMDPERHYAELARDKRRNSRRATLRVVQ